MHQVLGIGDSINDSAFMSEAPRQMSSKVMRRRVVVCTYLPMESGAGVERFVLQLSNALSKSGLSVEVIDADRVGINSRLRQVRYYCAWRVGLQARREAIEGDVIICNNFFSWNAPRGRSFVVFHGTDAGRIRAVGSDASLLRKLAVRLIGANLERITSRDRVVVAVSESARLEVEEEYHVKVDAVIPNAVDLAVFSPSEDRMAARKRLGLPADKFLVLFVGTTDPRKGLDWIVDYLKPLLHADCELVIRADTDRVDDGVRIVGRLPISDLVNLYRACDVLVFPTQYEGCSFGLIEAMACGLPVITSSAGSGRDLREVDTLRPYVIDDRDVEKYIDCINRLHGSEDEWQRVSCACRRLVERNHNLVDFEKAYLDLVGKIQSRN